jgi:lipoprotein-anchoring transpeptidase ErfK/SrfK
VPESNRHKLNLIIIGAGAMLILILGMTPLNLFSGQEKIIYEINFDNPVAFSLNRPKISDVFLPITSDSRKEIEIDLRRQKMLIFIDDKKIAEYVVSSGKRTTPTKAGNFSIISKYPVAYGIIDGVVWTMPYFMGIYIVSGAENGIHELPLANGWRESVRDMGYPVSHGCVRLGIGDAEKVYNFAKIGMPVRIHY